MEFRPYHSVGVPCVVLYDQETVMLSATASTWSACCAAFRVARQQIWLHRVPVPNSWRTMHGTWMEWKDAYWMGMFFRCAVVVSLTTPDLHCSGSCCCSNWEWSPVLGSCILLKKWLLTEQFGMKRHPPSLIQYPMMYTLFPIGRYTRHFHRQHIKRQLHLHKINSSRNSLDRIMATLWTTAQVRMLWNATLLWTLRQTEMKNKRLKKPPHLTNDPTPQMKRSWREGEYVTSLFILSHQSTKAKNNHV